MTTRHAGKILSAALPAVALLCGCVGRYQWVDTISMPPFDHGFIDSIAVAEFANRSSRHHAGRIVADRLEELLVSESPYKVVPRQLLAKYELDHRGRLDPGTAKQIREETGIDALVLGTVEAYEFEQRKRKLGLGEWFVQGSHGPKVTRKATVLVYLKLVDTETGRLVWSKSAAGNKRWTGWSDVCSKSNASNFLEKTLRVALSELKDLYPHRKKVRERVR